MSTEIENMARDLAMRGYAESTRKDYLRTARRLVERFGKPASQLSQDELRQYIEELSQMGKSSSCFRNQVCALLFLYRKTLGRPELVSFVGLPKRYSPLPEVLSVKEVDELLQKVNRPQYQAIAMVMYGAGLRIEEALALQVGDVDGGRGVLRIHHGKGDKAREAKLSPSLYAWLREYWRKTRPPEPHLFASRKTGKPPSKRTIRTALREAAKDAGIKKRMTPHVLRHSFATHLLEQGVDIYVVSALLGHKSLRSTQRYARVTRKIIQRTPSPLDLLPHSGPPTT